MTIKELRKLEAGSPVRWREGPKSPRAGELTDSGFVRVAGLSRWIEWQDGQRTDDFDDWALDRVEVAQ